MRGLPGGGAHVDGEGGRVGELAAHQALLGVGVAQPVAFVKHHQGPAPLRHAVLRQFVVLRPRRAPVAGGWRRHQRLGALVVGQGHGLPRRAGECDGAPPLRQAPFRADDEHVGLGHGGERAPHRQRLAEAGRVAEQEAGATGGARGQDGLRRRALVRARDQRSRQSRPGMATDDVPPAERTGGLRATTNIGGRVLIGSPGSGWDGNALRPSATPSPLHAAAIAVPQRLLKAACSRWCGRRRGRIAG